MFRVNDREYQISSKYALSYYSDSLHISDVTNSFSDCSLESVESDIIMLINKLHNIDNVWSAIKNEYDISNDDAEALSLYVAYIENLIEKGILVVGKKTFPIVGTLGKYYPIRAAIELTDKCNFECSHCYKEAGKRCNHFINTKLAFRILEELKGQTWLVEFTGGEALLHPDFVKIVNHVDFPSIALLTNGSLLDRIPIATLKKIDYIQVSIYGDTAEEYKKYARSDSFYKVCNNIKQVTRLGIDITVAIILRKSNYLKIRNYIELLSTLGVKDVRLGLTAKVGRNVIPNSEWDLSYEECCQIDEQLTLIKEDYPSIRFEDLNWRNDYIFPNNNREPSTIKCGAGKKSIVISERGIIRPCVMLPPEYFGKMHWEDYLSMVKAGNTVCYDDCVQKCYQACKREGKSIDSICNFAFE